MNLNSIPSGFPALDKLTGGFARRQLVTFAGQSASGLSTALVTAAAEIAVEQGERVLFVDLESSPEIVTERLVAAVSGIQRGKVRGSDALNDWESARIEDARDRVIDADLSIQHHLQTVKAIKVHALDAPPRLIVIDGTRLLDFRDDIKTAEHLSRLAVKLKMLATSMDTTVCVSQPVARFVGDGLGDEDIHPLTLNSDQIVMVRTFVGYSDTAETEMDVVKNRMGPLGKFPLIPQFEKSRFLSIDEGEAA